MWNSTLEVVVLALLLVRENIWERHWRIFQEEGLVEGEEGLRSWVSFR